MINIIFIHNESVNADFILIKKMNSHQQTSTT